MNKLFSLAVILLYTSCISVAMQKDYEKKAKKRNHKKILRTSGGAQDVLVEVENATDFVLRTPLPRSRSASPQICNPSQQPQEYKDK